MQTRGTIIVWSALVFLLSAAATGCDGPNGNGDGCGSPIGACGGNQSASIGQTVTLMGGFRLPPEDDPACQDAKDNALVQWVQIAGPPVTLQGADQIEATFVPNKAAVYMFRFEVTLPGIDDPTEVCVIHVTVDDSIVCGSPVADAGQDQELATPPATPLVITLDGTGSHTTDQQGCDLSLMQLAWTVVSQPAGASVTITNSDQAQASVSISVFGTYEFQLEVQDDGGTVRRTDTSTDVVQVEVWRYCGVAMVVTAIDAETKNPIVGANVAVTHSSGGTDTLVTDASGEAAFDIQDTRPPRSVTASSNETAPSIDGFGPNRQKYESTSVLEYSGCEITIPLRLTGSGEAAKPTGTVVAKVPAKVFDILPHSWKCLGDCQFDNDCDEKYYCEMDPVHSCFRKCTPRSLLPFFSLGDANISGQFRFAMLVPVLSDSSLTYRDLNKIFAPPIGQDVMWPGNLVTDDTFLNGLGPSFGIDVWGEACVSTSDCPNTVDYICEQEPDQGDFQCKDKNPMRNIKVDVPAGQNVKLALVLGIMDVSMMELLPVLFPMLTGVGQVPESVVTMLSSLQPHTTHVCIFSVSVTLGDNTDISDILAGLDASQCWNVDCVYEEGPVPLATPGVQPQACMTDMDCCSAGGSCGWPDSGMMCLPDPSNPTSTYCYVPVFRVQVVTNDVVGVEPDLTAFDPTDLNADSRLCSQLPAEAPFEVMCPTATPGIYGSCDPPDIRQLQVPPNTDCSYPYGISLAAIDVPVGHSDLPEGGRVFIGFDFNRCPTHNNPRANFLVPAEVLDGSTVFSATQMYFRNLLRTDPGTFMEMPGYLTAQASSSSMAALLQLPPLAAVPALDVPPADVGFVVRVTFEAEDPTVFPPVLTRTYAVAAVPKTPQAGAHEMTYGLAESTLTGESLKGVVLSKVDYAMDTTYVDNWWRVYMPAGTTRISLPAGDSPFTSGDYVWIAPFGAGFGVPFDYDLFPTDVLLGPLSQYSEDSYAVIVP